MRDVKYKVWDVKNNEFIDKLTALYQNGTLVIYNPLTSSYFEPIQEDYDVIFYTGLKDKNGKEIYEGDIMIYPDEPKPRNIYQIIFDGGCFVANCRVGSYFKYMREFILDTIEIIGNIYENKELLNG